MTDEGRVITHINLFMCIRIQLIMATIQGFQHSDLSIDRTIDPFDMDPYCFNCTIPWTHFEKTLKSLTNTEKTPPVYKDNFWEARQLINEWNHNI